jgi:glutathione S-transferase
MPQYTLHYFDLRGRAEISRLIMNAAGIPYTEKRIQFQDWPAIKPTTVLGQVILRILSSDKNSTCLLFSLASIS